MVACPKCSHKLTPIDLKMLDEGLPRFIDIMLGKDPNVRDGAAENIHQQTFRCKCFAWLCGSCGFREIDDDFLRHFDHLDVSARDLNIALYLDFLDCLTIKGK
jgi:hypothetical protein